MNLRQVRESAGMDAKKACKKAKMSLPTWTAIESGILSDKNSLFRIAKNFNVIVSIHPDGVIICESAKKK